MVRIQKKKKPKQSLGGGQDNTDNFLNNNLIQMYEHAMWFCSGQSLMYPDKPYPKQAQADDRISQTNQSTWCEAQVGLKLQTGI